MSGQIVDNILAEEGIDPSAEREKKRTWKQFMKSHWDTLYMTERFHQSIGGQLIRNVGPTNDDGADGKVACRARLGGLMNYYYREAA